MTPFISLYVSLAKVWVSVSAGQRLLFQVSVPVTLGQEVYGRAWCHLLRISPCKQTEIAQIVRPQWLVTLTGCILRCGPLPAASLTCFSSLLSEKCNILGHVFLVRTVTISHRFMAKHFAGKARSLSYSNDQVVRKPINTAPWLKGDRRQNINRKPQLKIYKTELIKIHGNLGLA